MDSIGKGHTPLFRLVYENLRSLCMLPRIFPVESDSFWRSSRKPQRPVLRTTAITGLQNVALVRLISLPGFFVI